MSLSERLRPSWPSNFLETWWASSDWLELMQGLANLIYNMKGSQNSGGILNHVIILIERITWDWVFSADSHLCTSYSITYRYPSHTPIFIFYEKLCKVKFMQSEHYNQNSLYIIFFCVKSYISENRVKCETCKLKPCKVRATCKPYILCNSKIWCEKLMLK